MISVDKNVTDVFTYAPWITFKKGVLDVKDQESYTTINEGTTVSVHRKRSESYEIDPRAVASLIDVLGDDAPEMLFAYVSKETGWSTKHIYGTVPPGWASGKRPAKGMFQLMPITVRQAYNNYRGNVTRGTGMKKLFTTAHEIFQEKGILPRGSRLNQINLESLARGVYDPTCALLIYLSAMSGYTDDSGKTFGGDTDVQRKARNAFGMIAGMAPGIGTFKRDYGHLVRNASSLTDCCRKITSATANIELNIAVRALLLFCHNAYDKI